MLKAQYFIQRFGCKCDRYKRESSAQYPGRSVKVVQDTKAEVSRRHSNPREGEGQNIRRGENEWL